MQEWNEYKNEYSEPGSEYAKSGSEYFEVPPEYPEIGTTLKGDMVGKAKKNTRKMVYLVAATVSVATMGQTLTPQKDKTPVVEQEVENNVDSPYEFEWPKVPGLDGTYGEGTGSDVKSEKEQLFSKEMLYLDAYEGFGYSEDGVVPVKIDGKWGLIDMEGNTLAGPKYSAFWMSPNEDGYTIFQDANGNYVIVGKDGYEYVYDSGVTNIRIGEDNIVSFTEWNEETEEMRHVYQRLNGNALYEMPWRSWNEISMANAFRNGKAYITYCFTEGGVEWLLLNEVSLDGTVMECMNQKQLEDEWRLSNNDSAVAISVYGAYDGYGDGYFVGTGLGDGGGIHLVSPRFGSATGRMVAVSIAELGINEEYVFDLEYYRSHGMDMMHNGSLGCLRIGTIDGESRDILFNFKSCIGDEPLQEYIACHDVITFDDYQYLAARDGEESFYIDLTGRVVSGMYADATAFNDEGYALVLDVSQTAYLIDDGFNVRETYQDVDSISLNDQLFVIHYKDGNADNMKVGNYGFYYGE